MSHAAGYRKKTMRVYKKGSQQQSKDQKQQNPAFPA
jgi:hypothetical protein